MKTVERFIFVNSIVRLRNYAMSNNPNSEKAALAYLNAIFKMYLQLRSPQ